MWMLLFYLTCSSCQALWSILGDVLESQGRWRFGIFLGQCWNLCSKKRYFMFVPKYVVFGSWAVFFCGLEDCCLDFLNFILRGMSGRYVLQYFSVICIFCSTYCSAVILITATMSLNLVGGLVDYLNYICCVRWLFCMDWEKKRRLGCSIQLPLSQGTFCAVNLSTLVSMIEAGG